MKTKVFLSLLLLATVVPGSFAAGSEDDTKAHSRTKSALVALVDAPAGRFRFVENVRQLVLAIVNHKRLETDAFDEPLRSLLVDLQADCIYGSLGRRLG